MFTKMGQYLFSWGNKIGMLDTSASVKTHQSFKAPNGTSYFWSNKVYDSFGNTSKHKFITTDVTQNITGNQSDGIAVGSGSTPATVNDYTLENQILTLTGEYSSANPTYTYDAEGNLICTLQYTFNNNTESDIVIREIGKFNIGYASTLEGVDGDLTRVLIDRTVLEEPLTVPAGESAVLRYSFVYPKI